MATLFSIPKIQAFDSSGDPIAGAQLFFYETATSLPQTVYQDVDLNTAHAHPVVSDAFGVFPAVWLDNLVYRVVLQDANAVTYWTVDGVTGSSGAASGAAVTYPVTADETAAVIVPTDTNYPQGDIRRYGAIANPATTGAAVANNAAINAALDVASIRGTSVYIPANHDYWLVSDEFTVGATAAEVVLNPTVLVEGRITIHGDGYSSQIRQSVAEKNIFNLGNDCTVEGVYLRGTGSITYANFAKYNGVYSSGTHGIRVRNCYMSHWVAAGVQLRDCTDYLIEGNTLFQNSVATNLSSGSSDILVYSVTAGGRGIITRNGCYSNVRAAGIWVNAIGYDKDIVITDNVVVTLNASWAEETQGNVTRRHGILVTYQGGSNSGGRIIVSGNIVRNCKTTGIYRASGITPSLSTGPVLISNNIVSQVGWDSVDSDLCGGIYLNNGGAGDTVSNNQIIGFAGVGGQNTGGAIVVVTQDATNPGHTIIRGNFINSTSGHGILLSSKVKFVTVSDNRIFGSTENDIQVYHTPGETSCGGHAIHDNYIRRTAGYLTAIDVRLGAASYETYITNNVVVGQSMSVSNNLRHAGILCDVGTSRLYIRDNRITSCYYGIVAYGFPAGRGSNPNIRRNMTSICSVGVYGNSADPTVDTLGVFEGSYSTTTTAVDGAAWRADSVNGTMWTLHGNAAPISGTWILGDQVRSESPVGYIGYVCTAAGNPGTWKLWGPIA